MANLEAKPGSFFVVKEFEDGKDHFRIKQMLVFPDGSRKPKRVSKKTYSHVPNNFEAMQQHCDKLNYGLDLKKQRKIEIESTFLPKHLLELFRTELENQIPNKKDVRYIYNRLFNSYFLDFFVNTLKLPDPKDWIKKQSSWGLALKCEALKPSENIFDHPKSNKTLAGIVQVANRFMAFLHVQSPLEYPLFVFQPLSKATMKSYAAQKKKDEELIGQFIPDEDWIKILEKIPSNISSFIQLMYFYGLRRGESLGFVDTGAVKRGYLRVTQQLKRMNGGDIVYSILKDKEQRNTPHWFCTPDKAFKLVRASLDHKMHPDTLATYWDEFMEAMEMDYHLHDFRRTFITKALRLQAPRDVQLAVGHASLETTMGYAQDDRKLEDAVWKPA